MRIIKRVFLGLILIVALAMLTLMLSRTYIVDLAIKKINHKLERHSIHMSVDSYEFKSFLSPVFHGIVLGSGSDTLITCNYISVTPSVYNLIRGFLPVKEITIDSADVHLNRLLNIYRTSGNNNPEEADTGSIVPKSRTSFFKHLANDLADRIRFIASLKGTINHFEILKTDSTGIYSFRADETVLDMGNIRSEFIYTTPVDTNRCRLEGAIEGSTGTIMYHLRPEKGENFEIPFLSAVTGVYASGGNQSMVVTIEEAEKGNTTIAFSGSVYNPELYHWRLSTDTISADTVSMIINATLSDTSVTVANSILFMNKLPIITSLDYSEGKRHLISFTTGFRESPADIFFNSLPRGVFNSIRDIRATGTFGYQFSFSADLDNPDSLTFNSTPVTHDFSIKKFGAANPGKLNSDFIHIAKNDGKFLREVNVSPENNYYTPLDQISPLLINSVLTNEDGRFFTHQGFNANAIRESMVTNIKERRFARGGSTITMQLVKNIFLSNNKNITRKLEEIILVWLIENKHLVDKERILEVYLNIIEWGPGIYGIGEASEFYFNKKPRELSLEESVYLSAIIPRPRYYRYTFDKEGNLRDYMKVYFRVIAERMAGKELITEQQREQLDTNLRLTGPAGALFTPAEIIAPDSIMHEFETDLSNPEN